MVLRSAPAGPRGAGSTRPTGPGARSRLAAGEQGSQALEFALTLPAVALVLVLVIHVGGIAADVVRVQHLARDAARAAVLGDTYRAPRGARIAVAAADGTGTVRVTVRLRSRWASRFARDVEVVGRAVMPTEPGATDPQALRADGLPPADGVPSGDGPP